MSHRERERQRERVGLTPPTLPTHTGAHTHTTTTSSVCVMTKWSLCPRVTQTALCSFSKALRQATTWQFQKTCWLLKCMGAKERGEWRSQHFKRLIWNIHFQMLVPVHLVLTTNECGHQDGQRCVQKWAERKRLWGWASGLQEHPHSKKKTLKQSCH